MENSGHEADSHRRVFFFWFFFNIFSLLVILTSSPPDGITAMEPWPGQAPECLESSCRGFLPITFFPTHVFYTSSLHRSKNSAPYPKRRRNVVAVLGLEPSRILKLGACYNLTCKIRTRQTNPALTSTNVTADCYVNKLTLICMLRKTLCHKNVMLTFLCTAFLFCVKHPWVFWKVLYEKKVIIISIDTG